MDRLPLLSVIAKLCKLSLVVASGLAQRISATLSSRHGNSQRREIGIRYSFGIQIDGKRYLSHADRNSPSR
jgi:hypothetical protein